MSEALAVTRRRLSAHRTLPRRTIRIVAVVQRVAVSLGRRADRARASGPQSAELSAFTKQALGVHRFFIARVDSA